MLKTIILFLIINASFSFAADQSSKNEISALKKGEEFLLIDAEGSYYEGVIKKVDGQKISVKYYWQDGIKLARPFKDRVESKDLSLKVRVSSEFVSANCNIPVCIRAAFANGIVRSGGNHYLYFTPGKYFKEVKTLQGVKRRQDIYAKGVNGKYIGKVIKLFANGDIYYQAGYNELTYGWTAIDKISVRKKPTLKKVPKEARAEDPTLISLSEFQSINQEP